MVIVGLKSLGFCLELVTFVTGVSSMSMDHSVLVVVRGSRVTLSAGLLVVFGDLLGVGFVLFCRFDLLEKLH